MGYRITLDPRSLCLPGSCAVCGGARETLAPIRPSHPLSGPSLSLLIPICRACGQKSLRPRMTDVAAIVAGVVALLAAAGAARLVAMTSWPIVVATGAVVGWLGLSLVLGRLLRRWDGPRGVELVSRSSTRLVLQCSNARWAKEAALLNDTPVRGGLPSWWPWAPGLLSVGAVTFVTAIVAWDSAFTRVYIDHGFGAPVTVWVDGEPRESFATAGDQPPPSILLATSSSKLGWAPAGESAPRRELGVQLTRRAVLFNPGATRCYLKQTVTYHGNGSASEALDFRAPAELHDFGPIDSWWQDLPETLDTDGSTKQRSAVFRNAACDDALAKACPPAAVTELLACQRRAHSALELRDCAEALGRACGKAKP